MKHLPEAALNQHIAVLGKTGAGKTYRLRGIIEWLLDKGHRVCVLDPKGDHWGVRRSADGKHAGYPVMIFGGEHADVPINERSGATIGELIGTGNRPCVVDLSTLGIGERTRFFMDFAAAIFRHNRAPLWMVIDEVHNFAPQGKVHDPDAGKMLHWANRLASEGRGKGLRLIIASQRPQKVHKDTLTCAETLIAMRVVHVLDRNQIKEWMDGAGQPDISKQILSEIAGMPRGEAWVWSPEIGFLERNSSPKIKTYDSMKAPEGGADAKLKGWADVDLDDVKAKLADVVKEAEANDPRLLRKQIAELQRQSKAKSAPTGGVIDTKAIERAVEKAALERDKHWTRAIAEMERAQKTLVNRFGKIAQFAGQIAQLASLNGEAQLPKIELPKAVMHIQPQAKAPRIIQPRPAAPVDAGDVTRPQLEAINAFAWYEMLGIAEPTDAQLCYKLGYSPTSSTMSVILSALRRNGYVEGRRLIEAARPLATVESAGSLSEFHDQIRSFLDGGARKVFDMALEAHPRELTAEEMCEANNWSTTSSTLSVALSPLRRAGLMEKRSHRLTDVVFPEVLV